MRELPILFSTPMVQAILDGRKTQTRRVIKIDDAPENWRKSIAGTSIVRTSPYDAKLSRYAPGDILWVRETWADNIPGCPNGITYRADHIDPKGDGPANPIKWKPSIHMPKEAARIWLEVTDVRVERLQEITWKDVEAEGLRPINNPLIYEDKETTFSIYQNDFINLWNDIAYKNDKTRFKTECGKYTWGENPWVWVIEFRRIEP